MEHSPSPLLDRWTRNLNAGVETGGADAAVPRYESEPPRMFTAGGSRTHKKRPSARQRQIAPSFPFFSRFRTFLFPPPPFNSSSLGTDQKRVVMPGAALFRCTFNLHRGGWRSPPVHHHHGHHILLSLSLGQFYFRDVCTLLRPISRHQKNARRRRGRYLSSSIPVTSPASLASYNGGP